MFAASGPHKFAAISGATSGDNTLVAAVDGKRTYDVTPANVQIGDVFSLTVGLRTVSFTADAGTVANVCTGLAAAWNNSTLPEFTGVTATDATTKITLKADVANVDFVVTGTAVNGGANDTQTLTIASVVGATPAKRIRVLSLFIVAASTVTVRFESGAGGTALTGLMTLPSGQLMVTLPFSEAGWFQTAAAALLNMELGGSVQVSGGIVYQEVN